jgi:hypothetical protein
MRVKWTIPNFRVLSRAENWQFCCTVFIHRLKRNWEKRVFISETFLYVLSGNRRNVSFLQSTKTSRLKFSAVGKLYKIIHYSLKLFLFLFCYFLHLPSYVCTFLYILLLYFSLWVCILELTSQLLCSQKMCACSAAYSFRPQGKCIITIKYIYVTLCEI